MTTTEVTDSAAEPVGAGGRIEAGAGPHGGSARSARQASARPGRGWPGRARPGRRRWPLLLALFLVVAMAGGAAYVAYRTPVLGMRQLTVVSAAGDLNAEIGAAVTTAVAVPSGAPMIGLDLAAIRRRALTVPQIATAAVSRKWLHELLITVTARVPVAVTSANGALWLLDATGMPYLKVAVPQVPAGLLTTELATPGPADPATLAALAVIAELTGPVKPMVASVSAPSPYSIRLKLTDGRTVIWGTAKDGPQKIQILPAVLAQPGKTYDISDPQFVSVSPN